MVFIIHLKIYQSHKDENARIYYTIDGNQPDQNSQLFSNTITVNENMVVRAIAIRDGWSNSEIITKSYIFDDDYDLPSIFLTIKPDDFFNPDTGIYVKGPMQKIATHILVLIFGKISKNPFISRSRP